MPRKIGIHPEERVCKECKVNKHRSAYKLASAKNPTGGYRFTCMKCCNKINCKKRRESGVNIGKYRALSPEAKKALCERNMANAKKRRATEEGRKKHLNYIHSDSHVYYNYLKRCKKPTLISRGIKMELSFDQFVDIINKPCSYCGKDKARGVDRIDSNLSYTIENSTPCCGVCNLMKGQLSVEEFKAHIIQVSNHIGKLNE